MNTDELSELVRAAKAGEVRAFDKLVLLYQTKIYNLALNYVKQEEEAKDLAQDIFVTVYKSIATLKDDSKFSSWLFQVALNHCRNRYKKLQRRGFFSSQSIDDPDSYIQLATEDNPGSNAERRDLQKIVRQAIAAMPEAEKEIILLRDIQELSYEEISTVLKIPLGTVKSKLNRARTALKNNLKHLF